MSMLAHLVKEEGKKRKNENNMTLCRGCSCPNVILKCKLMGFIVIFSSSLGVVVVIVFLVDIERTLGIPPSQHQMCLPDGANIELLPEEPKKIGSVFLKLWSILGVLILQISHVSLSFF